MVKQEVTQDIERQKLFLTIAKFLKKKGARKVAIFGSYARGEQTLKSDIDILVEFRKTISLLDHIGIEQDLSEKLNIKVDLLTEKAISPLIMPYIKRDLVEIL